MTTRKRLGTHPLEKIGLLLPVLAIQLLAQPSSTGPASTFEVVSVKHSGRLLAGGSLNQRSFQARGDRLTCELSLANILRWAYSLDYPWLLSAPKWAEEEAYEVVALMPPGTSDDRARVMVQAMLMDRLKLVVHREARTFSVNALICGKSGPKVDEVPKPERWTAAARPGRSPDLWFFEGEPASPIQPLVALLTEATRRPVLDGTGLKGFYKFHLEWIWDQNQGGSMYEGMVAALPQIGLKLESRKADLEVLVVDHAEKEPIPN